MAIILWDIETVANKKAKAHIAAEKYSAPANYKDPEKIANWLVTKRHEEMEKVALHWWTGQIVCISFRAMGANTKAKTFVGPDEKTLLIQAMDYLCAEKERPTLIGKEADTFDRPYLIGRLLAHDLGIPDFLRPYRTIEDINHIFGFSSRCAQTSTLDNYAHGLGIPAKSGSGADVQGWFDAAELNTDKDAWSKIGKYCVGDVDIVHEMVRRWMTTYLPSGATKGAKIDSEGPKEPTPHSPTQELTDSLAVPFEGPKATIGECSDPKLIGLPTGVVPVTPLPAPVTICPAVEAATKNALELRLEADKKVFEAQIKKGKKPAAPTVDTPKPAALETPSLAIASGVATHQPVVNPPSPKPAVNAPPAPFQGLEF